MRPRSPLSLLAFAALVVGAFGAPPVASATGAPARYGTEEATRFAVDAPRGDTATLSSSTLYVAPNGSDGAAGTQSDPTTLASAITRIAAGGTIYMRGGTYSFSQTVTIAPGNNGTSSARKTLSAYPGETPVLNFSAQSEDPANRGLAVNGAFWHVNGHRRRARR